MSGSVPATVGQVAGAYDQSEFVVLHVGDAMRGQLLIHKFNDPELRAAITAKTVIVSSGKADLLPTVVEIFKPPYIPGNSMISSLTRASKAMAKVAGVWTEVANNVARIDESLNGLIIEPARTNGVRNPRGEGGVPGTPGTFPTNWSYTPGSVGMVLQTPGIVVIDGVQCWRLNLSGTTSTAGNTTITAEAGNVIAALPGQTWTFSSFCRWVRGGTQPPRLSLRMTEHNAAGVQILASGTTTVPCDETLRNFSYSYTTLDPNCAFVRPFWTIQMASGVVLDGTVVDIGWPQLELADTKTSPILPPVGTPGASTRMADSPVTGMIDVTGNASDFTVIFDLILWGKETLVDQVLIDFDPGTADNGTWETIVMKANTVDLVEWGSVGGFPVTAVPLGKPQFGTLCRVGFTLIRPKTFQTGAMGGAVVQRTEAGAFPITTSVIRYGHRRNGAHMNGVLLAASWFLSVPKNAPLPVDTLSAFTAVP